MCEHLAQLDIELKSKKIRETYRGQAWSENCREWVYYDCLFNLETIRQRYKFPAFIENHINNDNKSGMEAGFVCSLCNDGVIGIHPDFGRGKVTVE